MFRLLTSLPPGHVRFTIIDPIGIGRNFGAFMHLADYDGALVTTQVWTDPRQIEERLADLAVHMETVTQKYLRNEYATIEEYNAVAEEVAEPYRVLVVADFPSKFDEKSAARLAAIAAGGVPCGVLTLVAADTSKPLPPGFKLDELRPYCAHLTWNAAAGRLAWDDRDFGRYPLSLDAPPPAEFATRQIQKVGAAARDAKRVEVPFEFISPPRGAYWTLDSRSGIDVPLGKAGATKRQHFTLGHGTSQHVLDRRAHRLGQVDHDARPDHQPRLELQPRRDRPLPDRLQEGRRVQGLRHLRASPRERRRDRERARIRHQRSRTAGRRASPSCRPLPRRRRVRTSTAIATPRARPRCPASC